MLEWWGARGGVRDDSGHDSLIVAKQENTK